MGLKSPNQVHKKFEIRKIIKEVESKRDAYSKYSWEKDILWYKQRIYFPSSWKFKTQVLKENHDTPRAGHMGFLKTYHNIRQSFFSKGMKLDIQNNAVKCDTCQRQKFETIAPPGLLYTLHIPSQKWYEISMDFITGLPMSDGKDSIFVSIDRLTKYANFIAIS